MQKFKKCPLCGNKNSPISLECTSCESDLTNVKVLDEETEKILTEKQNEPQKSLTFRICDCGEKNLSNARKCVSCGEDISDVLPTASDNNTIKYTLSSSDGEYTFEINKPIITIGREQDMNEYLSKKQFVSRIHAKIMLNGDTLTVENLSSTNFTYVNNKKVSVGEQAVLTDGDELSLGGIVKDGERQKDAAYFSVRVNKCM